MNRLVVDLLQEMYARDPRIKRGTSAHNIAWSLPDSGGLAVCLFFRGFQWERCYTLQELMGGSQTAPPAEQRLIVRPCQLAGLIIGEANEYRMSRVQR